jgi:putative hydrolase of the HAD superfamily
MPKILRSNQLVGGVVFDGDDTLWITEQLYDEARTKARDIVAAVGIDGSEWETLERNIDVHNVQELGFGFDRFPTSCVQAYEEICERTAMTVNPAISATVRQAARSVFERETLPVCSAREVLTILRNRGYKLALLTKGLPELQYRRIESSGLKTYFDVIKVVVEKTPQAILEVLERLGVVAESSWMVGNSMRSDILPAIAVGMHAIWLRTHTWEYERALDHVTDEVVNFAASLAQVPDLISGNFYENIASSATPQT